MPKSDVSRDRPTILAFLLGYGGFIAGTILIIIFPKWPDLGGIVFWLGVFGIFWAGWSSSRK